MSQKVDFHCHSTVSDGVLSPGQLLQRAIDQKVDCLALTDHDTVAGVRWLNAQGVPESIRLIPGSELSCLWGTREIHVVALGFDLGNPDVQAYMACQAEARRRRSEQIADKLSRRLNGYSTEDCLEGAVKQVLKAQQAADPGFVVKEG